MAFRLPSSYWKTTDEFKDIEILDYDGWDRNNFEYSWNEPITKEEFRNRLNRCTQKIKLEEIK